VIACGVSLTLFVFPWSVADFAELPFGFLILVFNRFLMRLFVFLYVADFAKLLLWAFVDFGFQLCFV